jgi:hypothetical protein
MPRKTRRQFSYVSEPGDYVGQGETATYEMSSVSGFKIVSANRHAVQFQIQDPSNSSDYWNVEFAAAKGSRLKCGHYPTAMRFGFHEGDRPGLDVSGQHRGSNKVFGEFTIKHISFNRAGHLTMFEALFEQRSERPLGPALRGRIYYCIDREAAKSARPSQPAEATSRMMK